MSGVDTQIDCLHDLIDLALRNEQFGALDILLGGLSPELLGTDMALTILITTLPADSKLPHRFHFYSRLEAYLSKVGEPESLLCGLKARGER